MRVFFPWYVIADVYKRYTTEDQTAGTCYRKHMALAKSENEFQISLDLRFMLMPEETRGHQRKHNKDKAK